MEIKKVIIPEDFNQTIVLGEDSKWGVPIDNSTLKMTPEGKLSAVVPKVPEIPTLPDDILTCKKLNDLPEATWKKGTVLLAKQDDHCVRLTALDSVFQEIGVGISANKITAFTDDSFDVVVTVTNTGEGKNDLTNLVINKPSESGYRIEDIRESKQNVDSFEKKSEFTYDIKGLSKGGTFTVRFKVIPTEAKTLQFTASVNPNTALDLDGKNNTATIILSAYTKQDKDYVPSVDCPLITATELDHNNVLIQGQAYKNYPNMVQAAEDNANIFAERTSLKGLRIRLENASTIVGYKTPSNNLTDGVILSNDTVTTNESLECDYGNQIYINSDGVKLGTGGYTFKNGILEITEDLKKFAFSCRPQGNNCRWQTYLVYATKSLPKKVITTTNISGCTVKKEIKYTNETKNNRNLFSRIFVVPTNIKANFDKYVDYTYQEMFVNILEKLVITVKAGTAANVEFTSTDNYADVSSSQGKTTISAGRVTVSADAKSTDSVNTPYIQVIIED